MQRLSVGKNEAVADIIERILESEEEELLIIIPKGSRLTDSPNNFRLIAREAGVLSKKITIESVDEEVLARAEAAELKASHPLFGDRPKAAAGKSFSDIVSRRESGKAAASKKAKIEDEEPEEDLDEDEFESEAHEEDEAVLEERIYNERESEEEEVFDTLQESSGRGRKVLVWGLGLGLLVVLGMWFVASAFGNATINISFVEYPWEYGGTVTADVAAKNIDPVGAIIPAELAEPQETLVGSFPATGRTSGGQKARATLTIVNEHGSEPQELVATTRFLAPDGKLFRLDNGVVVPGATVDASGEVTASSSIKATVTADEPGPEYNVGTISRLEIPGFQGTTKYEDFYGILEAGASGGTNTGGAAPTEADISNAKEQMQSRLNDSFQSTFLAGLPEDFKVLPQATTQATTTFNVNSAVDDQGNFSIVARTAFQAFEFRESDLVAMLNAKSEESEPEKEIQDLSLNYSSVSPDFSGRQMTFTLAAGGVLAPEFNPGIFANDLTGKSRDEARQMIMALPELADAEISIWPAWLRHLPKNAEDITIQVL